MNKKEIQKGFLEQKKQRFEYCLANVWQIGIKKTAKETFAV